jgi:hypothetical protein
LARGLVQDPDDICGSHSVPYNEGGGGHLERFAANLGAKAAHTGKTISQTILDEPSAVLTATFVVVDGGPCGVLARSWPAGGKRPGPRGHCPGRQRPGSRTKLALSAERTKYSRAPRALWRYHHRHNTNLELQTGAGALEERGRAGL